jgi:hypothetical protein
MASGSSASPLLALPRAFQDVRLVAHATHAHVQLFALALAR